MSQILNFELIRPGVSRQRKVSPISPSLQRHFDDCLRQAVGESPAETALSSEQDHEAQRQRRQQLMLQALQDPGGCYRDQHCWVRRESGMCLNWRLLNGPLAGLLIKAERVNGQLYLTLFIGERAHYLHLLSQRAVWLRVLAQRGFAATLEICYGIPSTG